MTGRWKCPRGWKDRAARFTSDFRGAALPEFGFVAPVMILFMMGAGDLLYGFYVSALAVGAVQDAGRDGTLQDNATISAQSALDAKVLATVQRVAPNATIASVRQNYSTFAAVDKPEPHTDKAGGTTGVRDSNECFSDTNGNGVYDLDGGRVGVGGANDVAQYTATVTYPRLFPIAGFMGWSTNGTVTASTVLKNQPYAAQVANTPVAICP